MNILTTNDIETVTINRVVQTTLIAPSRHTTSPSRKRTFTELAQSGSPIVGRVWKIVSETCPEKISLLSSTLRVVSIRYQLHTPPDKNTSIALNTI